MFPFQKIFTMLIRTFSRPMLAYAKRKQIQQPGSRFASFFVRVGRRVQALEYWVNHRILKSAKKRQPVELREELLLEKGVESSYELLFYLIVLGLPFWELYRSSVAAQKKEETLQKRIASLEKKMGNISERIGKIVEYAKDQGKKEQARVTRREMKDINLNGRKAVQARMSAMGETTATQESESASEKIEELFENAIEVMADEFEDSLDDLEFSSPSDELEGID